MCKLKAKILTFYRCMQLHVHWDVRFRTKLESPITINEPFYLVVYVLRVKFGIHLVTLNRTEMFKTLACKFSRRSVSNDFHLKSNTHITPRDNKSIFLSAFA